MVQVSVVALPEGLEQAVPATVTVAPLKFVPVIVSVPPPVVEPELGETEAIVGAET